MGEGAAVRGAGEAEAAALPLKVTYGALHLGLEVQRRLPVRLHDPCYETEHWRNAVSFQLVRTTVLCSSMAPIHRHPLTSLPMQGVIGDEESRLVPLLSRRRAESGAPGILAGMRLYVTGTPTKSKNPSRTPA